ncbi:hypothetical protein AXF42_Ash018372 [Apostasia shenzhenica]|uniref:Uncharacterized protein n=1 Tax=Apostasia shenzhenica TaxID=1088818 RepID=A0A2H9ZRA9_9ASPA|nr:hypothetical protein AXF42_Ash018372 [Apostasia shenzhenica]
MGMKTTCCFTDLRDVRAEGGSARSWSGMRVQLIVRHGLGGHVECYQWLCQWALLVELEGDGLEVSFLGLVAAEPGQVIEW